jgi:hypothetical protein
MAAMGRLMFLVLMVVYMLLACDNDDMGSKRIYFFDFKAGTEEWHGFFSDGMSGSMLNFRTVLKKRKLKLLP